MQLSLNWLRDYLQKPDVRIEPKELAEKLTMRGIPVESIREASSSLDKVVVGRIEVIEKHPNADRLQVTQIQISDEPNHPVRQIVCGAKNIQVGDTVPVALPGAMLPGDLEIKLSKIRGVESTGMLCSGKELGVADDSEGILKLPKHSKLGDPVSSLLGGHQSDTVMELELTANRSDCLSMMGLAREICPILKTKVREPKPARFKISPHRTSSIIKVEVEDSKACPRYVARVLDTLKVEDSPEWMKQRLQSVGIRPINNIVDVTNFVMYEYGQPMHAFDLRRIQSGTVRVGVCKDSQEFTLLTGETVRLEPGDILILDGDRPIALAGIMGGENSQVSPDTTSIVLESAAFDPRQIRKTAKRLGLVTESSKRFEKGCDLSAVALASERAAALLRDSFHANVYHPAIDTDEFAAKEKVISVDLREVRRTIGLKNISSDTVIGLLESIGIAAHRKSINILSVRLPSFRQDLTESIDIVEEVARLQGYEVVPTHLPLSTASYERLDESGYQFEQKARHVLCAAGLRETIHYSFVSDQLLTSYGLPTEGRIAIQNPINEDMKVMRTSLLPSLLQTYQYNRNRRVENQKLFEVGNVYRRSDRSETGAKETLHIAGLISGVVGSPGWKAETAPADFFHGKGVVETLLRHLTTVFATYEPGTPMGKMFHPKRSAVIKLGMKDIGYIGEIHPNVREHVLKTTEPVVAFEINLKGLRKFERTTIRYKTPSRFPASELDLAFVVDSTVLSQAMGDTIKSVAGNLLHQLSVFDVYQGEHVAEGKKSLGFRLSFQSPERTLNDDEVVGLKTKIIQTVEQKHSATLRS
jgi:phenylalanyl-tRNA synthetase beta chain